MALSKEARQMYDGIRDEYGIQDKAGLSMLLAAAESLDMVRKAEKEIEKHGLVIEDKYSKVKSNPACIILKDHRTLMLNYLKALSLDFSTVDIEMYGKTGKN